MTNDISKKQMCVRLKGGIEIWIDQDKSEKVISYLESQKTGFARIEDNLINLVEIEGVFTPQVLDEMKRRKNGQIKCKFGNWHIKDEPCVCGQNFDNAWTPPISPTAKPVSKETLDNFKSNKEKLFGKRSEIS